MNGLSDETKAPFKSEIVLPRISSTESARGALNDANNVYSKETNPRSKKDRKHRKRSRTSSKEKKIVKLPKRRKGPGAGARVRVKLIRKEGNERNERRTRRNETGPSRD